MMQQKKRMMSRRLGLFLLSTLFIVVGCEKTDMSDDPTLPDGATPYSAEEAAFVSYTTGEYVFKKSPAFSDEISLTYHERREEKQVYAWSQTYLKFSTDTSLEVELRLRYLETEDKAARKTLAIYMPYRDFTSAIQYTIFETPIYKDELEAGFFQDKVTFHDTLDLGGSDWYNVFEILPLSSTPAEIDDEENFEKIYYSKTIGLIEIDQKNGNKWVFHP